MAKEKEGITYSPESWEYSRGYAGVFGTIPSSFTTVTRSLMTNHTNRVPNISGNTKYFVLRLLKSNSLFAPLCFAYRGVALNGDREQKVSRDDLVAYFDSFELSYMLGLTFLFRRVRSLCPKDEWNYIGDPLMRSVNVGFLVGRAIPTISGAMGMIEGSIRFLAIATFLKHDPKGFKEYRRELKKAGKEWDDSLEVSRWGCTSLQIASVLLQTLGFGIPRSNAFVNAFATTQEVGSPEDIRFARDFRMSYLWRQLFLAEKFSPDVALPSAYYPRKEDLNRAISSFELLQGNDELGKWLTRTKDDLSPSEEPVAEQTTAPIPEGLEASDAIPDGFEDPAS